MSSLKKGKIITGLLYFIQILMGYAIFLGGGALSAKLNAAGKYEWVFPLYAMGVILFQIFYFKVFRWTHSVFNLEATSQGIKIAGLLVAFLVLIVFSLAITQEFAPISKELVGDVQEMLGILFYDIILLLLLNFYVGCVQEAFEEKQAEKVPRIKNMPDASAPLSCENCLLFSDLNMAFYGTEVSRKSEPETRKGPELPRSESDCNNNVVIIGGPVGGGAMGGDI